MFREVCMMRVYEHITAGPLCLLLSGLLVNIKIIIRSSSEAFLKYRVLSHALNLLHQILRIGSMNLFFFNFGKCCSSWCWSTLPWNYFLSKDLCDFLVTCHFFSLFKCGHLNSLLSRVFKKLETLSFYCWISVSHCTLVGAKQTSRNYRTESCKTKLGWYSVWIWVCRHISWGKKQHSFLGTKLFLHSSSFLW